MLYLIVTHDKPGSEAARDQHRTAHYDYLLKHHKLLLASGGLLDDAGELFTGGMFLLEVGSRAEAEAFVANDPFTKAGLFETTRIERWKKAFFNFERVT